MGWRFDSIIGLNYIKYWNYCSKFNCCQQNMAFVWCTLPLRFSPLPLSVYPHPHLYNCNVSIVICHWAASLRSVSRAYVKPPQHIPVVAVCLSGKTNPQKFSAFCIIGIGYWSDIVCLSSLNLPSWPTLNFLPLSRVVITVSVPSLPGPQLSSPTPPWWPTLYFLPLSC